MPTYHYRCSKCEQHLEVVQSMTDDPITECAACGGTMQKVLQPVGIVLKGSGFYRTDSRGGAKKSSDISSDSSSSSSSDSGSSSSKSDSSSSSESKSSVNSSSSSSKTSKTSKSAKTAKSEVKSA